MAQVDRLPETLKQLLQVASVLGCKVPVRLLEALWEESTPLAPLLQQLQQQAFLSVQHDAAEPVYFFKHALLRQAVYESLLTSRRQMLHTALERVSTSYRENTGGADFYFPLQCKQ